MWKSKGHIIKITNSKKPYNFLDEEIGLELKNNYGVPTDTNNRFKVEFVWKSTSFDRMQLGLRVFVRDESSLSGFLFHKILGTKNIEDN